MMSYNIVLLHRTDFICDFEGGMGSVYACTRRKDSDDKGEASRQSLSIKSNGSRADEKYALKAINTSIVMKNMNVTLPNLRREIECLKDLDHPYIVKCIETFESSHGENIFIIMVCINMTYLNRVRFL